VFLGKPEQALLCKWLTKGIDSKYMRTKIADLLKRTMNRLFQEGVFLKSELPEYAIEIPREEKHGDFAANLALTLAGSLKKSPREIARIIADNLDDTEGLLDSVEVAGPGFINFFINESSWKETLKDIIAAGPEYGKSRMGEGKKVQVEFVSANPTGPLHVGHGRGAAVGDALANIIAATGFEVQREYYINDAGTQMETLGRSVWLRCREISGESVHFPESCYQGDYIRDLAEEFLKQPHAKEILDSEERIIPTLSEFAARRILESIETDLKTFGVTFDSWFSEKAFVEKGVLDEVYEVLREKDLLFKQDGALWFRATQFGDEKDRVLVRSNGAVTYFATDVAYHWEKVRRGLDLLVDVWGADHHGYIPRIRAVMEALGGQSSRLNILLVQLVNLVRGGEQVAMSTRAGQFVTLRQVVDEVGSDVARFIFLTRKADAPLDFDLDLAKKQTNDNPVFYVQYAHARIASVLRLARERGINPPLWHEVDLTLLGRKEEMKMIKRLNSFPEEVETCAKTLEPHRLTYFLGELVADFHRFYHEHRIISDHENITKSRLFLVDAVKTVIKNGLSLLGVNAPERM